MKKSRDLTTEEINEYLGGMSAREISLSSELSLSSIRQKLQNAGLIRNKSEARALCAARGIDLNSRSRLSTNENGSSYASILSQAWLSKPLH